MTPQPDQPLQQAVQAFQNGRLSEARRDCQQAIDADPRHATAHQLLGLIEHRAGRFDQAVAALRASITLGDEQAPWHFNLGVSLRAAGDTDGAVAAYRRACELDPRYALAWHNLGTALLDEGDVDEAIDALSKAVGLDTRQADWWGNLGAACLAAGRSDAATNAYQRAVKLDPNEPRFHAGLGDALSTANDSAQARRAYQQALKLDPSDPELMHRLGQARRALGNAGEAERWYRAALEQSPDDPQYLRSLALVLRDTGRPDEADDRVDRALALAPDHPELVALRASLLNRRGKANEAAALLHPLLERGTPCVSAAIEYALVAEAIGQEPFALQQVQQQLTRPNLYPAQQSLLHFAAARLLDRMERFDDAFDDAQRANKLRRRRLKRDKCAREIDQRIEAFSANRFEQLARAQQTRDAGRRMVFVVGMPRSGTTLVEQIIAAHPQAIGVGESPWLAQVAYDLPGEIDGPRPYTQCLDQLTPEAADTLAQRYLENVIGDRTTGAGQPPARVVDKMPGNFIDVGLIALLFPEARIIHCQRDPRDVCLSCYFHHFGGSHPYAYDLSDLGFYHGQYQRLMDHWHTLLGGRVLPVSYEQITDDLEGQSRRLIDHLGLDWDDRCLSFHEQDSNVVTSSFAQVRKPIYRSSVGKWQHYASQLGPLLDALGMSEAEAA